MPERRAFRAYAQRLGLVALAAATPQQALAACDLAADLATLHNAYSDLIEGGGTPRADIGRYVINQNLIEQTERNLIQSLNSSGFYDLMPEIQPVLDDMASLAQRGAAAEELTQHRNNIESLTNALRGTGCFEAPGTDSTPASTAPTPEAPPSDPSESESSDADVAGTDAIKRLSLLVERNAPLSYGVLGVFVAGLCALGWFIRKLALRNRARAFPRFPFGGKLPITDALGRRKDRVVVDISQGGLMIERPNMADTSAFEDIQVRLPSGDHALFLVWENTHFLGYQFETALDEDAIARVLEIEVQPGQTAAAARNENSAPEGAALPTA